MDADQYSADDFLTVARAVVKLNKHQHGADPHAVREHMLWVAQIELKGASYVATGGWMVTSFYPAWDKERLHYVASVAAHCFNREGDPA